MKELQKLITNLKNAKKALDLDLILYRVVQIPRVQRKIIQLNQKQLKKGLDSSNRLLSSYKPYSEMYAKKKGSQLVDLNVDGNFYDTFEVRNTTKGFTIIANTSIYDVEFTDIYGKDIIGLSERSLNELGEFMKPYIIKEIYEILQFNN